MKNNTITINILMRLLVGLFVKKNFFGEKIHQPFLKTLKMSDSDSEEVNEIRCMLPNGKEYLVQNGVPFKIIDQKKGEYFSGSRPKVKFITPTLKQWFNPDDVTADDLSERKYSRVDVVAFFAGFAQIPKRLPPLFTRIPHVSSSFDRLSTFILL
jgi:hypothetical protein